MAKFSKQSLDRLITCHKDLQVLFMTVITYFDCSIICGNRTQEDQDKAFKEGKSKVKYPNSKHNSYPSMAVDVMPYPIDWNDITRIYYFAGFVKAIAKVLYEQGHITHQVIWGGDWDNDTQFNDNNFDDLPHFELR